MFDVLFAAFGLWLILEGIMYAAAPEAMKRFGEMLANLPESAIRQAGLLSVALGGVAFYVAIRFGSG